MTVTEPKKIKPGEPVSRLQSTLWLGSVFPTISVQVALSWVHEERVPSCLPQLDHFILKCRIKPLGVCGRDEAGEATKK